MNSQKMEGPGIHNGRKTPKPLSPQSLKVKSDTKAQRRALANRKKSTYGEGA